MLLAASEVPEVPGQLGALEVGWGPSPSAGPSTPDPTLASEAATAANQRFSDRSTVETGAMSSVAPGPAGRAGGPVGRAAAGPRASVAAPDGEEAAAGKLTQLGVAAGDDCDGSVASNPTESKASASSGSGSEPEEAAGRWAAAAQPAVGLPSASHLVQVPVFTPLPCSSTSRPPPPPLAQCWQYIAGWCRVVTACGIWLTAAVALQFTDVLIGHDEGDQVDDIDPISSSSDGGDGSDDGGGMMGVEGGAADVMSPPPRWVPVMRS